MATNIGCAPKLQVFNSLYSSVDKVTAEFLTNLFGSSVIEMGVSPQQDGATDCGVALANNKKPGQFIQENMRAHLVKCFENCFLTPFLCLSLLQ